MNVKIQKNIPIPPKVRVGQPSKYPYDLMNVGDSFARDCKSATSARAAASVMGKRLAKKFVTRPEGSKYRVWRVE